jgi:hypothetical protein
LGTGESERRHEGVGWRIGVRTAVNLRNRADRDLEEIARAFNPEQAVKQSFERIGPQPEFHATSGS